MPDAAPTEYRARRARWAGTRDRLAGRDRNLAVARLAIFAVALVLLIAAVRGGASAWWLILPLAAFVRLLQRHDRVIRARKAAARLVEYYDRALARIEGRWIGQGDTGERFLADDHPYAADLDLFGRGSLFELLSLARTRAGEETLAAWLKQPATADEIVQRHHAVDELRPALDLREALTLAGADIRAGVHPDELLAWATTGTARPSTVGRIIAMTLTAALPLLVIAWWRFDSVVALGLAVLLRIQPIEQVAGEHVEDGVRRAESPGRDLDVLRPALELLETSTFECDTLRALQARLEQSEVRASAAIRSLRRYLEMHEWTHNVFFAPIAAVLMWNSHLAWAVARWRLTHGARVGGWLRVVGELEALSSIAAYAYEHPEDPFPTLSPQSADDTPQAVFAGSGLGHPLLPAAQMVRNDVRFDDATRLIVVSGSNMSGKSTLLRTVGINAVLALAGAPVRATSLHISPVAIGATLRIQDSLEQGRSRFFAEITRIRQIADLAARGPLLFLLDELFHGTNSHDRLIGAPACYATCWIAARSA